MGSRQYHSRILFARTRPLSTKKGQRGNSKILRRISMVRYWILLRKPFPVQFKQASWSRSRKGKIKQAKRNILARDKRNKPRPSIQKIMDEARSEESSSLRGFEEEESRQQSDTSILPSNEDMKTSTKRPGMPRHLLSTDSERSPNET